MAPKPISDFESTEHIGELWEEFLMGTLDESGAAALCSWFATHPRELAARRKEASVHGGLSYLLDSKVSGARLVKSVQARLEGKLAGRESNRFAKHVMQSLPARRAAHHQGRIARKRAVPQSYWGVAAGVAIAVVCSIYLLQAKPQKPAVAATPPPPLYKIENPPNIIEKPVLPPTAPVVAMLATVQSKTGTLQIDNAPVASGIVAELKADSAISLGSASTATVTLADGTTIDLDDDPRLTLLAPENGPRLKLAHGRADIFAQPQIDGKRILVLAPFTSVTVVGTHYRVDAFDTLSRVVVQSGKVRVATESRESRENQKPEELVSGNQEIQSDAHGLSAIRPISTRREIEIGAATPEEFADPARLTEIPGEQYQDLPIRKFRYDRPKKNALGFAGITWPVALAPDEEKFEIHLRPRWVKPELKNYQVAKAILLAQLGDTEYLLGEVTLPRGESNEWIVMTGSVINASLRWQNPGTAKLPLKPESIKHIALRSEIGEMELDYTPIIVIRKK